VNQNEWANLFRDGINSLLWAEPDATNDNLGLSFSNTRASTVYYDVYDDELYVSLVPTVSPTKMPTLLTESPTSSPTVYPTSPPSPNPTELPTTLPTESPTSSPTVYPTSPPSPNPTELPTPVSTNRPTVIPTPMPTQTPTNKCEPYSNHVDDLSFIGVGSNCRGGLDSSYPGGLTCDSPYVICLPHENTPAAIGDQYYYGAAYRYSVNECLQECANDQRCSGIEFIADSSSPLGNCNLIDDIPVITSMVNTSFVYDGSIIYPSLDNATTGAEALCFQKQDYCNPYFEAEDLTDDMLHCYCPNNRKGFYTKKVKRTVENSRFCGNDPEVDVRIQKAQANRMFHLCENWCLYQTEDPEAESWFYDPWKSCWREQYAGVVVAHRTYCNRVVTLPDTIEMQFINNRVRLFCNATDKIV